MIARTPKSTASLNTSAKAVSALKFQLSKARLRYKPERVKVLLIGEAPPDGLNRFFYYEDVSDHDHLFLNIAEVLYPELKAEFLLNKRDPKIKKSILNKFKGDGFYLIDLSSLPMCLRKDSLALEVPSLIKKISKLVNADTRIILVKVNVYDTAFLALKRAGFKVVDNRIPFPAKGSQETFRIKFRQALCRTTY